MRNLNKFSKIFLFICFTSGALWFGSYFARLTLTYHLFKGNQFQLNDFVNGQNLPGIISAFNAVILLTSILYIIFIVSLIIFLISSKINLKQNGWLFIISAIIFITLPFEVYLMTIDYRTIIQVAGGVFNANEIINLYVKRFKVLSSFPVVEIICYFAVIFFILFQPFKYKQKEKHED